MIFLAAANFSEASPPAFIPQTPFCGRENSAEVLPNPFPQKIVLAKPSPFFPTAHFLPFEPLPRHTARLRAEPRKKNTLSFFKKKFTLAKTEKQGVFFFRGCRA